MSAPPMNINRLKNGSKSSLRRLVIGELPAPLISVKREGRSYRRMLEGEILATSGEITAMQSHHVDTASAATIHGGIMRWLLRNKIGEMNVSDIVSVSREILKSKQARDVAVKALELGKPIDPWSVIDVGPATAQTIPADDDTAAELELK